jgi:hypothetical protein
VVINLLKVSSIYLPKRRQIVGQYIETENILYGKAGAWETKVKKNGAAS